MGIVDSIQNVDLAHIKITQLNSFPRILKLEKREGTGQLLPVVEAMLCGPENCRSHGGEPHGGEPRQ